MMCREYDWAMSRAGYVVASAVGVFGALGLLAAGCSSDEAAPATTVAEATVVETTSTPPATTPPSTDVATTVAPTTTLDPAALLAAEVEADFLEADRLGREASMDPFDAEKEAAALDRRLGVIRDNFAAKLADYRMNNYAIRASDVSPPSVTVELPATLVVEGGDVAEMQICEVDSWVLVEVGAGPNGTDAIVNAEVVASRADVFMRDVGGVWKFEGGAVVAEWEGLASCPSVP
jgi:hypothetical protein